MGPLGRRLGQLLDRLRQPAYTGENRCLPCTALNLTVAAVLAAGVTAAASAPAGAVAFAASAAVIYVRGYLVPGTPTLTARYLPRPLLRLFGKGATAAERPADLDDVESVLSDCGVLARDGDSPRLAPDARDRVRTRIATVRDADVEESHVAAALGVDPGDLSVVTETGVLVRGDRLVEWESGAALVADVAIARELSSRCPGWADLDVDARTRTLSRLRLELETCPTCDGPLSRSRETVDPCCGPAYGVVSSVCEECDSATAAVRVEGAE